MKNLVIQAQRLGDLVMSYPLFSMLKKQDNKELFVLAEKKFYKELMRLSPQVTYIPTEEMDYLKNFSYDTLINLSHRHDTAKLAGTLEAKTFFGLREKNESKQIFGKWQLYRASLTHNNHYNRMHWADLNMLDCTAPDKLQTVKWKKPKGNTDGSIGLFVGASEEGKRPSIDFWAEFARQLCKKGYNPIFICGPNQEETEIARTAAKKAGIPRGVIAGTLSIFELTAFLKNLQLFICPDTGPMHIASFANVPTLNLSIGPVHPWETAPYPPYHYVLRSAVSCSGCWQCTKHSQLCRNAFVPHRIANLVHSLILGKELPLIPALTLYTTARSELGLYELVPVFGEKKYHAAQADFWRFFFLFSLSGNNGRYLPQYEKSREELFSSLPKIKTLLQNKQLEMVRSIAAAEKSYKIPDQSAWKNYPPLLRPLSSYIQLLLENDNYSKAARLQAMLLLENFKNSLN